MSEAVTQRVALFFSSQPGQRPGRGDGEQSADEPYELTAPGRGSTKTALARSELKVWGS